MIGDIILGLYGLGYVGCWRTIVYAVAEDDCYSDKLDGGNIGFGIVMGTLLTGFWPIILVGMIFKKTYRTKSELVESLIKPRHVKRKTRDKQRLEELQERERRVAALERELGIGIGQ